MDAPDNSDQSSVTTTSGPTPKLVSVKVTNLAPATSVRDLHSHFSYAGAISSIHLQPGVEGSSPVAFLTFLGEEALEKALLLSDSSVKGSLVKVQAAEADYSPPHDATFYPGAPLPKPQGTVRVTGLAAGTTTKDLQEFFSCAGAVSSISLLPGSEGQGGEAAGEAHVSFYEKKAVDTALLLSEAKIKGSTVRVEAAVGYQAPESATFFPPQKQVGENPVKQAEAMVRRLVEQGLALGGASAQKVRDFDQKHQITRTATTKAIEFRESAAAAVSDLQKRLMDAPAVVKSIHEGTGRVDKSIDSVDQKFKVTEKAQQVFSTAEQRLTDFGNYLLQNKVIAQGRDLLLGTAARISDAVEGNPSVAPGAGEAAASSTVNVSSASSVATTSEPKPEGSDSGAKASPEVDPLLERKESEEPVAVSKPAVTAVSSSSRVATDKPKTSPVKEPLIQNLPEDDTPVF